MADLNSPKDLLTSLPFSERRLQKMERQLAVPRTDVSVVATLQTTSSPTAVALDTADKVTVVTSAVCLIHIYFEVMVSTTAGTLSVWVRDEDAAVNTLGAASSSATAQNLCVGAGKGTTVVPSGNYLTFANTPAWSSASNSHSFSLQYSTTAGTATFYNRKLFAWVQPF